MFNLEGPARKPWQNRLLAAYLSVIAGYVNSAGYLIVGSFTSHVTGSAGRLANDVVARDYVAAVSAFFLVMAFFLGAFSANAVLQTRLLARRRWLFALLLLTEAGLLEGFVMLVDGRLSLTVQRRADAEASVLCFAMGLQNSLVTVISDARVRTTHLTGVVTDLGIEAARWVRFWAGQASTVFTASENLVVPRPPQAPTAALLMTILFGFLTGAVLGAEGGTLYGARAFYAPAIAAALGAVYAAVSGRRPVAAPQGDQAGAG